MINYFDTPTKNRKVSAKFMESLCKSDNVITINELKGTRSYLGNIQNPDELADEDTDPDPRWPIGNDEEFDEARDNQLTE